MRKLFGCLLTLTLLFSCAPVAYAEENTDFTTGTPWLECDLEGNVTEETPLSELKDHFALAVNREDILHRVIAQGRNSSSPIVDAAIRQNEDLQELFRGDAPEGHDPMLAWKLYQLMTDWDGRNAQGVEPLKKKIDAVEEIGTTEELLAYLRDVPGAEQLSSLWHYENRSSAEDASVRVLYLNNESLLIGDSAEYSTLTDYGKVILDARSELAERMLRKLGCTEEEAKAKIDHCLAFEKMLAPAVYTDEESNLPDFDARTNNLYSGEKMAELMGRMPVIAQLEAAGYPENVTFRVERPEYFTLLNQLVTEEQLTLIKDCLIVRGIIDMADYLDRESYDWSAECSAKVKGSAGVLDDAAAIATTVSELLPWPVGRLYADRYLNEEDKDRIAKLIDEAKEAYHGLLSEADFLSDATKEKALEKLEALGVHVLYPEDWSPYACEELDFASCEEGGTLMDAITAIYRYEGAKQAKEYAEPVDKELWDTPPFFVNCYYQPEKNSITIFGAFCKADLYNSEMSDEELYGKMGVVIGHEISHAFDSSGAQYDKDGNLANWWTHEDLNAFKARNGKMVAYYRNIHPWEGMQLQADIMTGEACADMAGMKCMLRVVRNKENFDYDKFFRAYAGLWSSKETLQRTYSHIKDVHPLNYLRINCTLQQYDEFLDFYGIREGDGMYLAPEDRANIW